MEERYIYKGGRQLRFGFTTGTCAAAAAKAAAQMLLDGGVYNGHRILSETAVDSMTRAQVDDGSAGTWEHLRGYGYGRLMRICTDPGKVTGFVRLGEYGWDGGLGTYFANIPSDDMTILFMTNAKDSGTLPVTRKVRNVVLILSHTRHPCPIRAGCFSHAKGAGANAPAPGRYVIPANAGVRITPSRRPQPRRR